MAAPMPQGSLGSTAPRFVPGSPEYIAEMRRIAMQSYVPGDQSFQPGWMGTPAGFTGQPWIPLGPLPGMGVGSGGPPTSTPDPGAGSGDELADGGTEEDDPEVPGGKIIKDKDGKVVRKKSPGRTGMSGYPFGWGPASPGWNPGGGPGVYQPGSGQFPPGYGGGAPGGAGPAESSGTAAGAGGGSRPGDGAGRNPIQQWPGGGPDPTQGQLPPGYGNTGQGGGYGPPQSNPQAPEGNGAVPPQQAGGGSQPPQQGSTATENPSGRGPYVPPPGRPASQVGGNGLPVPDPMEGTLGPPMGMGGGFGGGSGGYGSNVPTPANNISAADRDAAQAFLRDTINKFQAAQDSANAANTGRYNQQLDVLSGLNANQDRNLGALSGLYGNMTGQYAQGANNIMGQYNQAYNDWASNSANVGRGYDNLNSDLQARNNLLGQTEATNIDERFGRQQASADQDLINRGLGNTTVRSSVNRGIGYDKSRAQTALAQDVNAIRNQTDMSTRLPELSFGERANQFGAGLQTGNAAAQTGLIGNIANLQGQGLQFGERANQAQNMMGQNIVNTIGARVDQGPDYNTLAQLAQMVAAGGYGWGSVPGLPLPGTGVNSPPQAPNLPYYPGQPAQQNQQNQRPVPSRQTYQPYATVF